jgi:hypothetical protein
VTETHSNTTQQTWEPGRINNNNNNNKRGIMSNLPRDLEIVGLHASNNGRSCCSHATCGDSVKEGDLLRLVQCVVTVKGEVQNAIKCVHVVKGKDSCCVAYVPRLHAKSANIQEHVNGFVQVVELYNNSENSMQRRKSHSNHGMASCVLVSDIPRDE